MEDRNYAVMQGPHVEKAGLTLAEATTLRDYLREKAGILSVQYWITRVDGGPLPPQ